MSATGSGRPAVDLRVYLITDPLLTGPRGLIDTVRAAVAGGVTLVQLRDKTATDAALIDIGRALLDALAGTDVPLIVNDRIAVAAALGAAGVHLGDADASVTEARAALGPQAIVGCSVRCPERARAIDPALVDYLGVGPVFASATKAGHAAPIGIQGLAAVCAASQVPVVAIGGLSAAHVAPVRAAGGAGLAVVSAICAAADPRAAAHAFRIHS